VPSRDVLATDGTRLSVHDLGGSGRPLLLVHATGFHARAYAPLASHLARHAHVYGLDLRAHGASDRSAAGDLEWSRFGEDVLAALGGLALERPIGVGHSCGGAALVLAELARPKSFALLYLFEPMVIPAPARRRAGVERLADQARHRRARFATRAEALERYASRAPLAVLDRACLAAYVEHGFVDSPDGGVVLACDPEDEARVFEAALRCQVDERLGELDCPVVVAFGSSSDRFSRDVAAATAAGIDGAVLAAVDGVGHFGPLEDPARVAGSIVAAIEAARA